MANAAKKGTINELLAATKFVEAGFEVFHNISPNGPADLVVWDLNNTYLIDVKTLQSYSTKAEKVVVNGIPKPNKRTPGVLYLGFLGSQIIWGTKPPKPLDIFGPDSHPNASVRVL